MTSLRNIPVAESDVYRSFHQGPQESDHAFRSTFGGVDGGDTPGEASKWAFLKRLLEIEEAHDKRRRARERQERALRQAKLKPPTLSSDMGQSRQDKEEAEPRSTSKCLGDEVLTQSTGHTANSIDKDHDSPKIPSCSEQDGLLSSRKQSRHSHIPTCSSLARVNLRKHQESPPEVVLTNGTQQYHDKSYTSPEKLRHLISTQSLTGEAAWHNFHDSRSRGDNGNQYLLRTPCSKKDAAADDKDRESDLSLVKCLSNRPTAAPKPLRQLRLPPILLPRLHTNKPRPLKFLEFPTPTKLPGPITEAEWEDLKDCRYIRHATDEKHQKINF